LKFKRSYAYNPIKINMVFFQIISTLLKKWCKVSFEQHHELKLFVSCIFAFSNCIYATDHPERKRLRVKKVIDFVFSLILLALLLRVSQFLVLGIITPRDTISDCRKGSPII